MTNNKFVLDKMEFEKQLNDMPKEDLPKFIARMVYDLNSSSYNLHKRVKDLEATNKKMFGVSGGFGGGIALGLWELINFLLKRGG